MSTDHEPVPQPENQNPPFLTREELDHVGKSFSYDDFNIVTPKEGEPYMVVSVPENVQPLVNEAFSKVKRAALDQLKQAVSNSSNLDISEEDQRKDREDWAQIHQPILEETSKLFLGFTLHPILFAAELGAQLNALKAVSEMTDPEERQLGFRELDKKQRAIRAYIGGENSRYIFASGDKIIYKDPKDLEVTYSPALAGRQN